MNPSPRTERIQTNVNRSEAETVALLEAQLLAAENPAEASIIGYELEKQQASFARQRYALFLTEENPNGR